MSGQDYPIKSNEQIRQFFRAAGGNSFLQYFRLPSPDWPDGLDRITLWHQSYGALAGLVPPLRKRFLRIPIRRSFPQGFEPFGGSALWSMHRDAIEYVSEFAQDNKRFVDFFKHVLFPEEVFFQTVLLNSPLAARVVPDNCRYVDWRENGPHPAVLTSEDLPALESSSALFARKFDPTRDAAVLDRIDGMLVDKGSA